MPRIRVLLAEDSLTVRKHLLEILESDPDIEVIGEAEDGKQVIALCRDLRPDVITMDMMMPVMSGLAATEYIMAHHPTPILIVSSSTNRGELFKTYEALAAGAIDVIEKPDGGDEDEAWIRHFLSSVKIASRIRVITHPRARLGLARPRPDQVSSRTEPQTRHHSRELIALGASTGGPGALVDVLRALPRTMTLPILFVLHISEPFGLSFADWLDGQVDRSVAYAAEGEPVTAAAGRVLMAPPGVHMIVRDGRVRLIDAAERHSCRPSVDVLFESVAQNYGPAAIAALLTGMGRDGAAGLLEIRRAGGATIAQDEASSIVYGMPREARLIGAAERILPLGEIGPALVSLASANGTTR